MLRFARIRVVGWICAGLVALAAGCGGDDSGAPPDAGASLDADSGDAGREDAGPADAGSDAGPPDTGTPCVDGDGDGHPDVACGGDDCDDTDGVRFPGATEVCDADDEDCDDSTFGADGDADGDGFFAAACCNGTRCGDDCDDTLNTVNPRAAEQCNGGLDDDCDGLADAAEGVCRPCPPGYDGFDDVCTDVNECATPGFCGIGAMRCTNLPGTFLCTCGPGYALPAGADVGALCENVNECTAGANPCGAGTCTDNAGSYACACPMGYRDASAPTITCVDIDECVERTAGCDDAPLAVCSNTMGGFTCNCPGGYEGDGRGSSGCVDVDECARNLDDCDDAPDACVNAPGTFSCSCPVGYAGTGRGMSGCLWNDATLSGLSVGAGAVLAPDFPSSRIFAYRVTLPAGATMTTLTPTVALPSGATIRIDGTLVPSGTASTVTADTGLVPRVVSIVVTAESGAMTTYTVTLVRQSLYVKASNTDPSDVFGWSVALSADGSTLAVSAPYEDSTATGVNGDGSINGPSPGDDGAVYVFRRTLAGWAQEAYIKASNAGSAVGSFGDNFGLALAISADGSVLAVGAPQEDSSATGVGGSQSSNASTDAGAVYVFRRTSGLWAQEAYVKASNTGATDLFGWSVALSGDGATLAVGARGEASAATGIGGLQTSDTASGAGAVYVFRRGATSWSQEAYVKASNTGSSDRFGWAVALSTDGTTLAVGANGEASSAMGVGGAQADDSMSNAGAVYVLRRAGTTWSQEAYVKASNTAPSDSFGCAVSLSGDGSTLAVGAYFEDSSATRVGGDPTSNAAPDAGAAYVFRRTSGTWSAEAYVKASNTSADDQFGSALALSEDGQTLVVGASLEDVLAEGIDGTPLGTAAAAGAAYVYRRTAGAWTFGAWVKASNTGPGDGFGFSVGVSRDGSNVAIGAYGEASAATGIGGDQSNNSASGAGAVYLF